MLISGERTWAQGGRELTLEDCIDLANEQSPESKIALKAFESVHWSYMSYRAGLKPQVSLDLFTPGLQRTIQQNLGDNGELNFIQQNTGFSSGNLRVSQLIAPTGGTVSLSSGLQRIDQFGPNGYVSYTTAPLLLGLQQPLFAFNQQKWEKKIQPLQYKRAEKSYLEAREQIAVDISGKYFDVYIAQISLDNALSNQRVNDSIFTISKGRYNVGKIAENDLLQTELAALNAKSEVNSARLSLEKAKTELAISLGLPNSGELSVRAPADVPEVMVDAEFALSQARSNRSEMIDFDVRGLQAESSVNQAKASNRFNANLNAEFGLNGSAATLPGAYSGLLDRQVANLSIGIPILQWGRGKAAVESALVERERVNEQIKLEKRRLERDIRFQVLDFLQLQEQVSLALKADQIAARRFNVAKNRYLIGKIDITNLQIAQNEKDSARQSYISRLRQFWTAYYQLRRSTLYDFIADQPLEAPDLDMR
ncbi:MAG: TolC family protein [Bacteroidota bacterium]